MRARLVRALVARRLSLQTTRPAYLGGVGWLVVVANGGVVSRHLLLVRKWVESVERAGAKQREVARHDTV